MRNTNHLVSVGGLTIASTLVLRLVVGWMFQLPYGSNEVEGSQILYYLGFSRPAPASAEAVPIDTMFNWHFWMLSFLFALIMTMMIYAVVVFRRKEGDESDGPHIHSNTTLEIGWTVVPAIVVIGFGIYGAVVLNDITAEKAGETAVSVTAFQWGWRFEYPEAGDFSTIELVLEVDQPVVMQMQSDDVLHAFWVPDFRVKQDLVPGRTTELRFTPTEVGDYRLRCAEICGTGHAAMLADVRVLSAADYATWVEEQNSLPEYNAMTPEERGEIWYAQEFGCQGCHSLDGSVVVGPSWQGLFMREEELIDGSVVIADEAYIRSSILMPNEQIVAGFNEGVMPQNYGERFDEFEAAVGAEFDVIDDLIAFIQTLE